MKKLLIEYPESIPAILNLSPDNFEQEAKMALAVKLYEMGRLTSGQAASLAGISRVAFLLSCKRYGSASVEWVRRNWKPSSQRLDDEWFDDI